MKLPAGKQAVVDVAKLRDYALNPNHPRGRHKARAFAAVVGYTVRDADLLRELLLDQAARSDVTPGIADEHGQRFILDATVDGPRGSGVLRSTWIVPADTSVPRLVTCFMRRRR